MICGLGCLKSRDRGEIRRTELELLQKNYRQKEQNKNTFNGRGRHDDALQHVIKEITDHLKTKILMISNYICKTSTKTEDQICKFWNGLNSLVYWILKKVPFKL